MSAVFLANLRARAGVTVLVGKASLPPHHTMMSRSSYRFLKGQIMTSNDVLIKHHNLVMFGDVTQHSLPSNSAEKGLINY